MTVATTVEVTMPQLGETVTEGTVTGWLKRVGDRVEQDEALVEIATDKVDTEVPSPASGILVQVLVDIDQTVAVGTPIALLDVGGAPPRATAPAAWVTPTPPELPPASTSEARPPRHRASPRVRRRAAEQGIDVSGVPGTGPGGRVTLADVEGLRSPAPRGPAGGLAGIVTSDLELSAAQIDRRELLAAFVAETLAALRRYVPVRDALVSLPDGDVGIAAAADLTSAAVAARLTVRGTDAVHAPLRVIDAPEVRSQVATPHGDEVAVLAVGQVSESLVPRGNATFALRAIVTVTLAYTEALSDAAARAVLASLASEVD